MGHNPTEVPPSVESAGTSKTIPDNNLVRAHLESVLGSSHFKNSKRCQALLRYTVEAVLTGRSAILKERVVGVEALGRDPGYDTTQDAVVRNVAIEVRKRLAQYYLEASHDSSLRIELPAGSYVPEFAVEPPKPPVEADVAPAGAEFEEPTVKVVSTSPRKRAWAIWGLTGAMALAVVTVLLLFRAGSDFDAFWAPLTKDGNPIQICVGEPAEMIYRIKPDRRASYYSLTPGQPTPANATVPPALSAGDLEVVSPKVLWRRDAFCAARLAAHFQSLGTPYRLRADVDAYYTELRGSPMIAIGGFDWRQQFQSASESRFGFRTEVVDGKSVRYVRDRQNPSQRNWLSPITPPTGQSYNDYAIVTRMLTSGTGKPVITIRGATDVATAAAGEFIIDPERVNEALSKAAPGWESKHIQFVIQARVIQDVPGPATAVAVHVW